MSCSACASRVEPKLNKLPGVRASGNFPTRVPPMQARALAPMSCAGWSRKPDTTRHRTLRDNRPRQTDKGSRRLVADRRGGC
ncbi:hypothetical protein ABLN97_11410 [Mycobacterium tuberculosis]